MSGLDNLNTLFVGWAFSFQILLILHFALRKRFFKSYTLKLGWIVYALCIPSALVSLVLLLGGKSWAFWMAGFIFLFFAAYGYWVDYVKKIHWRRPLRLSIMFPYVFLYLGTVMFYWWPLAILSRPLWGVFAILFFIGTILNFTSH